MEKVFGYIRTAMATAGGAAIGAGVVSQVDWASVVSNANTIMGSIAAIAAVGAQVYANWNQKKVHVDAVIVSSPQAKDVA